MGNKYKYKARPTNIRVPWFKSPRGTTDVAGYPRLAICARCKRLFNSWDAHHSKLEGILCAWCWNNVEPCKVCGHFYPYGSLDYTKICENCRNTGKWIDWENNRKDIKVWGKKR